MAYLICEKCGGYYELGENESPDDFESCSCGGNLKYIQNINSKYDIHLINRKSIAKGCMAYIFIFLMSTIFVAATKYFFLNRFIALFLAPIILGFTVAYTNGSDYKSGILNGIIAIIIMEIIQVIFAYIFTGAFFLIINEIIATFIMILSTILGVFIGASTHRRNFR